MKFIVFVEGHTEKKALPDFLRRWLDVRLTYRVGIKPVRFEGCSELWRDAPQKARLYLNGPDQEEILGVISLLDLYGPAFYPDNVETAPDRYVWAKTEMEKRVGNLRFRQFFAVHENRGLVV